MGQQEAPRARGKAHAGDGAEPGQFRQWRCGRTGEESRPGRSLGPQAAGSAAMAPPIPPCAPRLGSTRTSSTARGAPEDLGRPLQGQDRQAALGQEGLELARQGRVNSASPRKALWMTRICGGPARRLPAPVVAQLQPTWAPGTPQSARASR